MKILYFAWLRERLNRDSEEVSPPDDVHTVGDLLGWLSGRDETAAIALENRSLIRVAVDEELAELSTAIGGARTIALFPPMTGG
jgi:molybdopterin synthase sulfur carrier subunit